MDRLRSETRLSGMTAPANLLGNGDECRQVGNRFRGDFELVAFERFSHDGQQHVEDARRP